MYPIINSLKKSFFTILGLGCLAILPLACHLTNQEGRATLDIEAGPGLLAYDSVEILLQDAGRTDTLFQGKLPSLDTLQRLPALDYQGGKAIIIIQGYQAGALVYVEQRNYDGSTERAVIVIPLDLSRATNSIGQLDIRPDAVRLFTGGAPLQMEIGPVDKWAGKPLDWTTGNPAVATVSQSGLIMPIGTGVTYVRATSGDTAGDASAVTVIRDIPVLDVGAADTSLLAGASAFFWVKVTQEYGNVAAFAWDLDGDGTYEDSLAGTIGQTLFQSPAHAFPASGDLTVHFRARDGEGNVATAAKHIKMATSVPKIDSLLFLPAAFNIKDSVTFTAKATGQGAALLSYAWDFNGDGTDDASGPLLGLSASVNGGFRYPTAGPFQATLRVSDADGISTTAKIAVQVQLDKPIADAGPDLSVNAGAAVRLQGLAKDNMGLIVLREWKIGAAEFVAATDSGTASFMAPTAPSNVTCVFRVTDDDGLSAEDTMTVTVNDSQAPAISGFMPADTVITIKDSVAFIAQVTATGTDLKSYTLDIDGDGVADLQGLLTGRTGTVKGGHRYAGPGIFNVTLKVEDLAGKIRNAQARVTVLQDLPKAKAGDDTSVTAGTRLNLHGLGTDSLGRVVKLEWKIGAGPYTVVSKGDTSFTAPTAAGSLECVIRVTDDDGLAATDTVLVTISPAPLDGSADLSDLTLSSGALSPTFTTAGTNYTVTVAATVSSMTVTPKTASTVATVKVNGAATVSGSPSAAIALTATPTVISVEVTAQDGITKKTYTVTVTKALSSNANLTNLKTSVGALSPVFAEDSLAYRVTVPNGTANLTVTPTSAGGAIKVNGAAVVSGLASGAISLTTNPTIITLAVTAADGITTKSYSISVTQAASSNANLTGLTTTAGALSPAFAADTMAYSVSVPNGTASVTVTPTGAAGTTIKVKGAVVTSGSPSGAITLAIGANPIPILVTAADGSTTKTYTLTVTQAVSSNANLSNLTTTAGALAFSPATQTYSLSVPYTTASVTVTPTAAGATITVKGAVVASGSASGAITLVTGANSIPIIVTAADGITTKTYTLTVTKAVSSNSLLSGLALSAGMTFNVAFNSNTFNYNITASASASVCKFTPTAADIGASIVVDGTPVNSGVQSGALAFTVGTLLHTIEVFAPDGITTSTYNLYVLRTPSDQFLSGSAGISDVSASKTYIPGTDFNVANPAGDVVFTRNSNGKYHVTFKGLATYANSPGSVHIAPLVDPANTTSSAYCNVSDYTGNGDISVGVSCYFTSGGLPTDVPFSIFTIFPRSNTYGGNAFVSADKPSVTGAYTPDLSRNWNSVSTFNPNTVQRTATGTYKVTFKGQGTTASDLGNLMVTAVNAGPVRCGATAWGASGSDMVGTVVCQNNGGTAVDAQFNASMMKGYATSDYGLATAKINTATSYPGDTRGIYSTSNAGDISVTCGDVGKCNISFVSMEGLSTRWPGVAIMPFGTTAATCQITDTYVKGGVYFGLQCSDKFGSPVNTEFHMWVIK